MIAYVIGSKGRRSVSALQEYILYPERTRDEFKAQDLHRYVLRKNAEVRGAHAYNGTTSVETWDVEVKARMSSNVRANPDNHLMHFVLSLSPGVEHATDAEMLQFGRRALRALSRRPDDSLEDHQWLMAVHHDKEHLHIHVVVNMVSSDGLISSSWRSKIALETEVREISRERGWTIVRGGALDRMQARSEGHEIGLSLSGGAKKYEAQTGLPSAQRKFQDTARKLREELEHGATRDRVHQLLDEQGWDARRRGSGWVCIDRESGASIKPSNFGLSLAVTQRYLGAELFDKENPSSVRFQGTTSDELQRYVASIRTELDLTLDGRNGIEIALMLERHGLYLEKKGSGYALKAIGEDALSLKLTTATARARGLSSRLTVDIPMPKIHDRALFVSEGRDKHPQELQQVSVTGSLLEASIAHENPLAMSLFPEVQGVATSKRPFSRAKKGGMGILESVGNRIESLPANAVDSLSIRGLNGLGYIHKPNSDDRTIELTVRELFSQGSTIVHTRNNLDMSVAGDRRGKSRKHLAEIGARAELFATIAATYQRAAEEDKRRSDFSDAWPPSGYSRLEGLAAWEIIDATSRLSILNAHTDLSLERIVAYAQVIWDQSETQVLHCAANDYYANRLKQATGIGWKTSEEILSGIHSGLIKADEETILFFDHALGVEDPGSITLAKMIEGLGGRIVIVCDGMRSPNEKRFFELASRVIPERVLDPVNRLAALERQEEAERDFYEAIAEREFLDGHFQVTNDIESGRDRRSGDHDPWDER